MPYVSILIIPLLPRFCYHGNLRLYIRVVLQIKSLGQFGLTMETARNTFWFWLVSSGNTVYLNILKPKDPREIRVGSQACYGQSTLKLLFQAVKVVELHAKML